MLDTELDYNLLKEWFTRFKIRWNSQQATAWHFSCSITWPNLPCLPDREWRVIAYPLLHCTYLKYCSNNCCRCLSIHECVSVIYPKTDLASNTLYLLTPNEFGTVIFGLDAQRWILDKLGIQYLHSRSWSDKQFHTLQVNRNTHVEWLGQRLGHRIFRITVCLSFPVYFPLLSIT